MQDTYHQLAQHSRNLTSYRLLRSQQVSKHCETFAFSLLSSGLQCIYEKLEFLLGICYNYKTCHLCIIWREDILKSSCFIPFWWISLSNSKSEGGNRKKERGIFDLKLHFVPKSANHHDTTIRIQSSEPSVMFCIGQKQSRQRKQIYFLNSMLFFTEDYRALGILVR